ncbi:hypothetical protein BAE44_0006357 [Dichanthelium oligosanthes]|uniref:FLZ-type domain-containing protein n=1 Tax=Dichanthelium oligosanthes TaxID=888268 RepID=A0A1E5W5D2_9POAL|nr:hypothetical protein BAE44_0006357 [Dichanthelium oligosanthes]
MVESNGQRNAATPAAAGFFRVPGLFVRLSSSKGGAASNAVDAESVWSPTSPLDFNFKSLRSSPPRVGLGLVDALTTADGTCSVHLGCRSSFLDSIRPFLELALPKACGKAAASSAAGVAAATGTPDEVGGYAECEEYTCVISRGANPRTTHILAGETLEVRTEGGEVAGGGCRKAIFTIEPFSDWQPSTSAPAPASAASGRCRCCMKKLPEDRDIFMYLGKAFCSNECRKGYIEEEIEEAEELMILDSALNL